MRTTMTFVAVGLLLTAAPAHAQQTTPAPQPGAAAQATPPAAQATPAPQTNVFVPSAAQVSAPQGLTGWADFGYQFGKVDGDKYRLERYRDFSNTFLIQRFRMDRQGEGWTFNATGDHLGRRDRRVTGEFRNGTKVRASFIYDQIPLYISGDTRTAYVTEAPGVLRLDDALQAGIQAGSLTTANMVASALTSPVTSERRVYGFDFAFTPTRELAVKLKVQQTQREGSMPYGASFGFNDAIEVAAPIDTHTTDVNGGVEWTNTRGMVRVGYTGSNFTNNIPVLVWDNPLKLTDSTGSTNYQNGLGGSQGRAALPPSSTMQGITAAGSAKLPANSRVNANLTFGSWKQDAELLPVTINTAVPPESLPRQTTEGDARTLAMNYTFTSQPSRYVYLNARYRYYDFDNRTPVLHTPIDVVFDQTVHPGAETEPLSFTRQNVDLDGSFTPVPFTALRIGYSRNVDDRTFRIFGRTTENVVRASIDSYASGIVTVRAVVERGQRRGTEFDEELLVAVAEQTELRHYDVADRDRDRVTALVQLTPTKLLGFSGSYSIGRDNYLNSGMGLRNNDNRAWTITADLATKSRFAGGVSYTEETFTAEQQSRYTALPGSSQFYDETRDWFTDSDDKVRTLSVSMDVLQLLPRTDLSLVYDSSRARATYVYRLTPDTTLVPVIQLPELSSDLQTGRADLRVHLSKRVALGLLYYYDKYDVEDFYANESRLFLLNPTGSVFLGNVFRPYESSSAAVRLICNW